MVVTALNRKLLRDLLKMKGQALAIALVVAAGVSLYVTYLSNFDSLRRTQEQYYQSQRFADVFASLTRAPLSLAGAIRDIPGVSAIETRVVALVTLDLPDLDQPAIGRLVSIPANRRPLVNDLYLRVGTWIDPARPDGVLASEAFVNAHHLHPGDTVAALINGRSRRLTIAGVALSAEYIYSINPGEMVPDDARFGVFWMDERAMAAAFDMEGGFNDVALALAPGVRPDEPIARLDTLLERYGGRGAIPRALQYSNWTLENELLQLESAGLLLPIIFLLVAAFVLNVALSRALTQQRPQIASLKALGYSNGALAWHYLKWALLVGAAGLLLGLLAGAWLGHLVGDVYNRYFHFPELQFVVPFRVVLAAAAMTLGAAAAGAYSAVWRAVRIPPAEAMRPEPRDAIPADVARDAVHRPAAGQRRAHGDPERDAPSNARGRIHARHCQRGRAVDGRHRHVRRDGAADRHAVLDRRAAGRRGVVHRAAIGVDPLRARAPAGCDIRRDAATRRRQGAGRPSRSVSDSCRHRSERTHPARCRRRWTRAPRAAVRRVAVANARRRAPGAGRHSRSRLKCSRAIGARTR